MKILLFILVLANILFFAFSQTFSPGENNPDAHRTQQQIQPERIKILSKDEQPAAVEAPVSQAPAPAPIKP
jgi:hypothetical protein